MVKSGFIIALDSVMDFGRFNLAPINTQSIPDVHREVGLRGGQNAKDGRKRKQKRLKSMNDCLPTAIHLHYLKSNTMKNTMQR